MNSTHSWKICWKTKPINSYNTEGCLLPKRHPFCSHSSLLWMDDIFNTPLKYMKSWNLLFLLSLLSLGPNWLNINTRRWREPFHRSYFPFTHKRRWRFLKTPPSFVLNAAAFCVKATVFLYWLYIRWNAYSCMGGACGLSYGASLKPTLKWTHIRVFLWGNPHASLRWKVKQASKSSKITMLEVLCLRREYADRGI